MKFFKFFVLLTAWEMYKGQPKLTAAVLSKSALELATSGGSDQAFRILWFHTQCTAPSVLVSCHAQDWWYDSAGSLYDAGMVMAAQTSSCGSLENYKTHVAKSCGPATASVLEMLLNPLKCAPAVKGNKNCVFSFSYAKNKESIKEQFFNLTGTTAS